MSVESHSLASRRRRSMSWRDRLPFPLWVALRYARSTRSDAFIRILTVLTGGGLAVGVAATVVVLALLSGFQDLLLRDVLSRTPEIDVALPAEAPIEALRRALLSVPGVAQAQLLQYGRGWLVFEPEDARDRVGVGGGQVVPVEIVGYEEQLPAWFPLLGNEAPAQADASEPDPARSVVIPSTTASLWRPRRGDRIRVVSSRPTLSPFGRVPRTREAYFSAAYDVGRSEPDSLRAAIPATLAHELLGEGERRFDLRLAPGSRPEVVAARVRRAVGETAGAVATWRQKHRGLLFALKLEKALMFTAVVLIVLVASMALIASLALVIASKQAEIGTLATLGATPKRLVGIFLIYGAQLAALATVCGGSLGAVCSWLLDRWQVIPLPAGVYIVDHVPFLVKPGDVGLVLGATVALTLLASWRASVRAADLDPLEAIRD